MSPASSSTSAPPAAAASPTRPTGAASSKASSSLGQTTPSIRTLAARYGVQPVYGTIDGGRASASRASVAAVLRALGAPVDEDGRLTDEALDARPLVEPVTV